MFENTKAFSGFSVDDVAKAREFYGGTLGLAVEEENGMLAIHIADGGDIMAYPKEDHTPATFTILNFPVADIERAVDDLSREVCRSSAIRSSSRTKKGSCVATRAPRSPGSSTLPGMCWQCWKPRAQVHSWPELIVPAIDAT